MKGSRGRGNHSILRLLLCRMIPRPLKKAIFVLGTAGMRDSGPSPRIVHPAASPDHSG